ncbi:MAG: alpha-1,4-glucan--maltose-1-phosphate maltosyltransferase, partial [Pseudomonadota bacterium]|nr:alpha-1,4-glucan--maltose-1-phosphate maltosyltransferase [Pseudomonadota bacterium]
VSADIFADGHDALAAELLWRAADEPGWQRVPMRALGNDRWDASFTPARVGRHAFTIEAWWDEWGTFRRDLGRKRDAGQDLKLEVVEGRTLIGHVGADAPGEAADRIEVVVGLLDHAEKGQAGHEQRVAILLADETDAVLRAGRYRPFLTRHAELPIDADRPQAGFASWYEMFPRSATDDPGRHGTFASVIAELPRIRDMGFDVLYFPPISPIGRTNRKGRNNTLRAEPDDVGSPYAIGGVEGGHDAILPALGTLEDFRQLVAAARDHGLEIALDFAIQCSLDHPWLKQHPDWFRWRPDGSVRYAENPPKKYEDIVNVDFYAETAIPDLWLALRDVVQFWVDQGVRILRVDNPHTKPLPFWHWMIADIRARDPGVIFLSEAFTRPKVMYRLAKVGFTQSYTYFTWRNTKQDMTEYLTELNMPPASDVFRPNFFVNTPDIDPYFLQTSGRAGFLIRAALAATLSGLWGMYSGFELCEAAPLPGREEYLDSEKYEIRVRDWHQSGNIVTEIAALNRIRRANPALQSHLGVTFYPALNDQVLLFGKMAPLRRAMILVAVSFDPHRAQDAVIEVPLWEWGLSDYQSVTVEDLMRGHRFLWHGKAQRIRLDPADLPFAIWRVIPPGGTQVAAPRAAA